MKHALRLVDVAKAAGVSRSTASNVFTRPERVRPELRERVEAAARKLGYAGPDPKGRLLRAGNFNAIGVLPSGAYGIGTMLTDPYEMAFLAGVAEICEQEGAGLSLVSGTDDERTWSIRNALVDGFILNRIEDAQLLEPAKRRRLPYVVMDSDGDAHTNSVRIADRDGGRQAGEHLLALGHRKFATMTVIRQLQPSVIFRAGGEPGRDRLILGFPHDRDRLLGFGDALAKAGISIDDVPIVEGRANAQHPTEAAEMLLDRVPEATAVFAISDLFALALMEEARKRGLVVPRDLSVFGFDDVPAAARADPPLTTVVQPIVEKGRAAARLLFEGGPPRHIILPVSVVVRGSTAPPRR